MLASTVSSIQEKDNTFHCTRRIKTQGVFGLFLPTKRPSCMDSGCIERKDGSSLPGTGNKTKAIQV